MAKRKTDRKKLTYWQGVLDRNAAAYEDELRKMDDRETLYKGDKRITPMVRGERVKKAAHVRNICSELIEAQIDSNKIGRAHV